jgi:hypothetical protein
MHVIGVDPGPKESAYVIWDGVRFVQHEGLPNEDLVYMLKHRGGSAIVPLADFCAIEQIRGYGIPAGNELLDTCFWSGRFFEAWGRPPGASSSAVMIPRKDVLKHLGYGGAGNADAAVRAALMGRFGGVGTKRAPGPLWGISGHLWAALAVAVTFWDRQAEGLPGMLPATKAGVLS